MTESVIETEIHLYYITAHHDDGSASIHYAMADGANGFESVQ